MKRLLMVWLNILLVLNVMGYQAISATEIASSETIQYLDKDKFRNSLSKTVTDLYFGTEIDYDLTKCTEEPVDLGNGYKLYNYTNGSSGTVEAYVICEEGKKIIFPEDSTGLFSDYTAIKQITFNNIDTSNVASMIGMFQNCVNLSTLDLSKFDTSKVTGMISMFKDCVNLTTINLSSFNTENVTGMTGMFEECYKLKSLDLSNFKTSKVNSMSYMFDSCENLSEIDLSSFNTSKVTEMNLLFYGCNNLKTIYVTTLFKVPDNSIAMFTECSNLIGGQGTKYDSVNTDYKYAHIDGGEFNPGYFTAVGPYKPTLSISETYTYNARPQIAEVIGFYRETMKIDGDVQTDAGIYTIEVTSQTGRWSDGTTDSVTVEWTIEKANPIYTIPTDLNANQGDKLSDIKLPEGWSWNEPDTKLDTSGSKSYTASYTPKDTNNYNILEKIELTVTVKAINKSSDNSSTKQTSGWDDGGPFTTDKCGNVFDRWGNKIYEANGCNIGGYNLVKTSVVE